jgi:hypothetical protein
MKPFIPTKFYGYFNYILAVTFIASPWIFDFYNVSSAALFLPIYIGWLQLIMAIFVDNEAGIMKQFPMSIHLVLDTAMGFILMVSPWLWGYAYIGAKTEFWPQFLMGLILFTLGIFTMKSPITSTVQRPLPQGGEMTSAD